MSGTIKICCNILYSGNLGYGYVVTAMYGFIWVLCMSLYMKSISDIIWALYGAIFQVQCGTIF